MPGGGKIGFLSALYRSSGGEQEAPEGSSAAGGPMPQRGPGGVGDEGQGEREEVRQVVEARGGREGAGGRGHLQI